MRYALDEEAKYDRWLTLLFEQDESIDNLTHIYDREFLFLKREDIPKLFAMMWENFGRDVSNYSNVQISRAIRFILFHDQSEMVFDIRDWPVELETRIRAIQSIKRIFSDCFEPRCDPIVLYRGEREKPLNKVCYDFWSDTPLTYCVHPLDREPLNETLLEVMTYGLSLENIACQQSSFRGLVELSFNSLRASEIITDFVESHPDPNSDTRRFTDQEYWKKIHLHD